MNNPKRYFRMTDDVHILGRWHLKGPLDSYMNRVVPAQFNRGVAYNTDGPLVVPVTQLGHELDFSLTGNNVAVVSGDFVRICRNLGVQIQQDLQFIPAKIEGHADYYFVLNALRIVKCIDDAHCEEVVRWGPEHGEPERIGEYRSVIGLKIDPVRIDGAELFRPWGWTVALIVSERVKQAIEEEDLVGPKFTEV
jgi:hypothetical protein